MGVFTKKTKCVIEMEIVSPDFRNDHYDNELLERIKKIREALPDFELRVKIKNR